MCFDNAFVFSAKLIDLVNVMKLMIFAIFSLQNCTDSDTVIFHSNFAFFHLRCTFLFSKIERQRVYKSVSVR